MARHYLVGDEILMADARQWLTDNEVLPRAAEPEAPDGTQAYLLSCILRELRKLRKEIAGLSENVRRLRSD